MNFLLLGTAFEDGIWNWMLTYYPNILLILLVAGAAVYVTLKISDWKHRFKASEKQCDDLKKVYVPDLHKKFTTIDTKMNTILMTVAKISTHLITSQALASNIFESKSPMQLTSLGDKLLRDTGGADYINEHTEALVAELEKREPKSGLDVQNFCNIILIEKSADDGFKDIKDYVFQHPVYLIDDDKDKPFNLDMAMVTQIMGIYLRNKYFEKHPDLAKDKEASAS